MTEICQNSKPFNVYELNAENNQAQLAQSKNICLQCEKQHQEESDQNCPNAQQEGPNLQADASFERGPHSESENTDKKSLLTSMIRESQMLQNPDELDAPAKRTNKKAASDYNPAVVSTRRLLKELDLEGYRLPGSPSRRERRPAAGNCGQCSQCTIF